MTESQIFGVSIRSWAATFLIVLGSSTLAYQGEVLDLKELALAAMSFLFGKAAGQQDAANGTMPIPPRK